MKISEEKLEELVEEKVEERLNEESREEEDGSDENLLSRRNFIKKAGLGAIGVGTLALSPASSALQIKGSRGIEYLKSSGNEPDFSVDSNGVLDVDQIGSGSSPVSEIYSNSLNADNVDTTVQKPEDYTIQAIQDLIDQDKRNVHIQLEPGKIYEGSTQLRLDSTIRDEVDYVVAGQRIRIDAQGAGINYTGNKRTAYLIQQGHLLPSEPGISEDANEDSEGFIAVEGGTWVGPGYDVGEPSGTYEKRSAVFRQNPSHTVRLFPTAVKGAEHGMLVQWFNGWNEGCRWGMRRGEGYSGSEDLAPNKSGPRYLIRLAASTSDIATDEWEAGGSGNTSIRGSGRESQVYLPFSGAEHATRVPEGYQDEAISLWQDGTTLHGGFILLRGFVPRGSGPDSPGIHYKCDSQALLNRFCRMVFESEGGNEYSIPIVTNTNNMPQFVTEPRLRANSDKEFEANSQGELVFRKRKGIQRLDGNGPSHFEIRGRSTPGNGFSWLRYVVDYETRYSLLEMDDSLGLGVPEGEPVHVVEDKNNYAPIKTLETQIGTKYNDRTIKGRFDEHPSSVSNGDTWYITGNGSPEEGLYVKTSSGNTRIS